MNDDAILQRLSELEIELPPAPKPVASYVTVRLAGDTAFVAGQVPLVDGSVLHPGHLGEGGVTAEHGAEAARRAAIQALSALREALGGSFERLVQLSQVTVYLATTPDFTGHPAVANGASDLFVEVLGDAGKHARAAVGMASLPLGASVEVTVTALIS
ncbi:MAG TPA: RidA family protein [Actinomycetota bacterium]